MTSSPDALPSTGSSAPLGATVHDGGVNFSLYARKATAVELCLFDAASDAVPSQSITLDPARQRTGDYWHCSVERIGPGQHYGWRVEGPWQPQLGLRFDPANLLLDPYGQALAMPPGYGRAPGRSSAGDWGSAMKSVVADPLSYDWEGDRPLHLPARETVIYELHVRGFTAHPSAGLPAEQAGTYRGLINKIPYLQDLGITAVELLPVFAFDPLAAPQGHRNYWGYQPVSFFAPHPGYACSSDPLAVIDEFRDLVKALHRAGIEVILDVVFNHTAEGDANGPSFCFRGLADGDYYLQNDDGSYIDDTGCGNTINANHPMMRRLIRQSLRYWVEHLHVDGFRFDLASVLNRDQTGAPTPLSPIIWDIDTDPVLAGTKLIAEAWDAAGLYQVGSFVGDNWLEWNGRFRDDVRRFIRGDEGMVRSVSQRLIGSPDIYGHKQREAEASVNFITCHDGFSLADLVSYDHKHNETNGEDNRDGSDDNSSWNCGVEGTTDDDEVLALRARQSRNLLAMLLLAIGTPMLSMGDEIGRTQQGNNNAYCQDNDISWLDWSLLERNGDLHRFVRELIAFRRRRDVVVGQHDLSLLDLMGRHHLSWHGIEPNQPDWSQSSRSFAVTITSVDHNFRLLAMANAWWEPLSFRLPAASSCQHNWLRWIDTANESPQDIVQWASAPRVDGTSYLVQPRSIVVLIVGLKPEATAADDHQDPQAAEPA